MSIETIILIPVFLVIIGIIIIISRTGFYLEGTKKMLFVTLLFFVLTWVLSIFITDLFPQNLTIALWASRFSFFTSILIVYFYYLFIASFGKSNIKINNYLMLFSLITLATLLLTLTPFVVESVSLLDSNYLKSSQGDLYIIVGLYYFMVFFYSTFLSLKKWSIEKNSITKMQLMYISIGASISIIITLITNLIFPFIGFREIRSLGPISILFFIIFTSFAILRYRFFSAQEILSKSIFVVSIALIPFFAFYLVYFFHVVLWGSIFTPEAIISGFIVAILFILIYQWITNKIDVFLANNFFSKTLEKQKSIDEFIAYLGAQINPTEVIDNTIETLNKTFSTKILFYSIIYSKSNSDNFFLNESNIDITKHEIKEIKAIFSSKSSIIIADEFIVRNPHSKINKIFIRNKINLIWNYQENEKSIFILAKKNNSIAYSVDEVKYIQNILNTFTIALDRSILFSQVENFNFKLQAKVEDATEKITEQRDELEKALTKERDMLDILGHELRTPLSIVRNSVQMLKRYEDSNKLTPEKLENYLNIANENSTRLVSILETIFTSTKIDNQRLSLSFDKVDMLDVVNDGIEGAKLKMLKKDLKLVTNLTKESFAYADRNRTQEILDNLLDNAIKYTDKGSITIELANLEDKIVLSVKDTGRGISKEDIDKLGTKFFRTEMYLNSKEDISLVRPGGAGLGLYVVFNLAKAMKGKVEVESKVNEGTMFSIYLPEYNNQKIVKPLSKNEIIKNRFDEFKKKNG